MAGHELLDEQRRFAESIAELGEPSSFALDTEFVREKTYFARLCLVQVECAGRILLVDPLALDDLGPLTALLARRDSLKILHAARQDMEVLLPVTGDPPGPVLDTQVAASLLGYAPQIGYAELVRQELSVELAKGHARTNWAARPLRDEQLAYAADDVRYLAPVAAQLGERLRAADRLAWLEEDCAALLDPALYRLEPGEAWRRLKGLDRMRPEQRAALRALAAWREARAMRRNLPRAWVLDDAALRELARRRPGSRAELERSGMLSPAAASRLGGEILAVLANAQPDAEDAAALAAVPEKLSAQQLALVRRLQEILQRRAAEEGISPEVLATRRDLTAMVRGARDAAPLRGWRRGVIGGALLAAL